MSFASDIALPPRPLAVWEALPLAARNALAIAGITLFALVWQLRWGTIPDTSWLITACERMLSGERLYAEIYETNPPFSVWLYLPPVAAARWLGVAPEILVHAGTYLAALTGLLLAGIVLVRASFAETERLLAFAPAVYAMLVIYAGSAFSEREHIGVALFLPLLVLIAWRARTDAAPGPHFALAMSVGLSGSALLLVKPHYAVMVLAPVLWICWRKRSIAPLFALEHWVIGLVCSAYLAAVILVHPEFLRDIYPVLADTYLKVGSYLPMLTMYGFTWAALMFIAWRLWPRGRAPELASVFILASIAGILPLVWQAKGWAYHAYPAMFCAVLALICLMALPAEARRSGSWTGRMPLLMKPSGAIALTVIIASFAPFWVSQKPTSDVVSAVRAATVNPSVALIGSDMANGHPLVRMVDGRWASTHVSDWLGTFALYLSMVAQLDGDAAEAARYEAMAADYAAKKREEFLVRRPDIIAVQKEEAFWTRTLTDRWGFDAVLASYRLLAEDEAVEILIRKDYQPPPSGG